MWGIKNGCQLQAKGPRVAGPRCSCNKERGLTSCSSVEPHVLAEHAEPFALSSPGLLLRAAGRERILCFGQAPAGWSPHSPHLRPSPLSLGLVVPPEKGFTMDRVSTLVIIPSLKTPLTTTGDIRIVLQPLQSKWHLLRGLWSIRCTGSHPS